MSAKPTPDKAFKRATAGYELFGKKLFPFSSMRQATAASMGLRFGLVDQSDLFTVTIEELKGRKAKEAQFYNQMFSDCIKVLWLCSVPDSRVLRAERKIDEAKTEAFKWADEKRMTLLTEPYFAAAAVFLQMMQDIAVSSGEPILPEKKPSDDDDEGND